MIKYDLLFAFRNLWKQKLFSGVSLFGLCLGMVSVCLILIYVQHELSYDRFNKNANQIYRVYSSFVRDGKAEDWVQTPAPLADYLKNKFPEIKNTVRIATVGKGLVSYSENHFYEDNIVLADASLFDIFTYQLLNGNPRTILENPNTVIISKSIAEKYFGEVNPIGKTLTYNKTVNLIVGGIIKNAPKNTHLPFEMIISMPTAKTLWGNDFLTNQMNTTVFTYLLTHKGVNESQLKNDFADYYGANFGVALHVQSLRSIHLHSNKGGEYQPNGDIRTVRILSAIAALILLIACINYINLSLLLNKKRSTELGIRKVMGAGTAQLIRLFLSNSLVLSVVSLLISLLSIWFLLPWFNVLLGIELNLKNLNLNFFIVISLIFLFTVISTGLASGWLVAHLKPISALKKAETKGRNKIGVYRLLVLFQFTISIALIASTILITRQMNFVKNKNLGLSKDQLMIIPINEQNLQNKIQSYKQEILSNPHILSATATSDLPGKMLWITSINYEGQDKQSSETMTYLEIDNDFVSTYGIRLKAGYLPGDPSCPYKGTQYLLNETAASKLGWEQPLGKMFDCINGKPGTVCGIVNNFNFKSLHERIEPLFLYIKEGGNNYLTIKLDTHNLMSTILFVGQTWNKIVTDAPFEYFFYDDFYNKLYLKESRFSYIIQIFSCIAILITCFGLFGLISFINESKTKEIGIRKVNGARITEVMVMLNRDFIKWIAIAFIIACPIAWYAMHKWLESFAYKTELSWWVFVMAGGIALVIALITVSWQSWRAATRNPVESLRYE